LEESNKNLKQLITGDSSFQFEFASFARDNAIVMRKMLLQEAGRTHQEGALPAHAERALR